MLRECLASLQYQEIGLQAHADESMDAVARLNSVEPAFRFVEDVQRNRGEDCRVVCSSSVVQPKFSVVIPVYNTAPYLAECLDSVLNQKLADIEIVCVDDGSTDESGPILMNYAKKYANIKVLRQSNAGLSVARNHGLQEAAGEFIHFLDSDDFVTPELYETLYQEMTAQNLDMLFFNAKTFYETEELERQHPGHKYSYLWKKNTQGVQTGQEFYIHSLLNKAFYPVAWGYGVRTSFLKCHQLAFVEGVVHEDNFLTPACLLLANRVNHIPEVFYNYRIRHGSLTTAPKEFQHSYGYFANYRAFAEFLHERNFPADVRSAASMDLSRMMNGAYAAYKNIQDARQRYYYLALPPEESALFAYLIYERFTIENKFKNTDKKLRDSTDREKTLKNSASEQNKRIKNMESSLGRASKELQASLTREAELKNSASEQNKRIKNMESRLGRASKELQDSLARETELKNSASFRIGRAVTWLPRRLGGGVSRFIKRTRQQGAGYAIKRLLWHVAHLK